MSAIDINVKNAPTSHPIDHLLRADRLPHILCPGCGIGTVVHSYAHAIANSDFPEDQHVCVSGIGCSGRAAGYVNVDSYHATHGRALPFALGIAVHRPELKVTVISGDGDLSSIGGNHLIHAARRNVNMTVICINNFTYGMTGGQVGPTTPIGAKGTTAPKGAPVRLPRRSWRPSVTFDRMWKRISTMSAMILPKRQSASTMAKRKNAGSMATPPMRKLRNWMKRVLSSTACPISAAATAKRA